MRGPKLALAGFAGQFFGERCTFDYVDYENVFSTTCQNFFVLIVEIAITAVCVQGAEIVGELVS
jgi:hypothetical protein